MHPDKNQQASQGEGSEQRELDKNETLQDAGAAVPAYGRSGTEGQDNGEASGENSIPLRNDDTIGNP